MKPTRRQLLLASGICHYDSTLAGLQALNAAAIDGLTEGERPVLVVPLYTLAKLNTELRILLDRWDRDYPDAVAKVGVFDQRDLGMRAGLVRAWLTVHMTEYDNLPDLERG